MKRKMKINDLYESKPLNALLFNYVENPSITNKYAIVDAWESLIKKYPNEAQTVYRGINFLDRKTYDEFINNMPYYSPNSITSWTTDYNQAVDFATVSPCNIEQMSPNKVKNLIKQREEKDNVCGYAGVILSMKIEFGVGVDVGLSGASIEDEIILPSGVYNVNYTTQHSYKSMLSSSNINSEVQSATKKDKEKLLYILINKHKELSFSSFVKLFNFLWVEPRYKIINEYDIVMEKQRIALMV